MRLPTLTDLHDEYLLAIYLFYFQLRNFCIYIPQHHYFIDYRVKVFRNRGHSPHASMLVIFVPCFSRKFFRASNSSGTTWQFDYSSYGVIKEGRSARLKGGHEGERGWSLVWLLGIKVSHWESLQGSVRSLGMKEALRVTCTLKTKPTYAQCRGRTSEEQSSCYC